MAPRAGRRRLVFAGVFLQEGCELGAREVERSSEVCRGRRLSGIAVGIRIGSLLLVLFVSLLVSACRSFIHFVYFVHYFLILRLYDRNLKPYADSKKGRIIHATIVRGEDHAFNSS